MSDHPYHEEIEEKPPQLPEDPNQNDKPLTGGRWISQEESVTEEPKSHHNGVHHEDHHLQNHSDHPHQLDEVNQPAEQFWSPQEEKEGFEHEPAITPHHPVNPGIELRSGSGSSKRIISIVLIVLGVLLVSSAVFWYFKAKSNSSPQDNNSGTLATSTPWPVMSPTPQPTATPEAIDYSKYSVQILNGSGTPGEAAKVQTSLISLGFKKFQTGNAKSFTYKTTQIQNKKDTPAEVMTKIKDTLSKTYDVEVIATALSASEKNDVIIIIGSSKP